MNGKTANSQEYARAAPQVTRLSSLTCCQTRLPKPHGPTMRKITGMSPSRAMRGNLLRSFHANNNDAKSLSALAVGNVAGKQNVMGFGVDGHGLGAGEGFGRLHHFKFSRRSL